jgi:hypothetical protein
MNLPKYSLLVAMQLLVEDFQQLLPAAAHSAG